MSANICNTQVRNVQCHVGSLFENLRTLTSIFFAAKFSGMECTLMIKGGISNKRICPSTNIFFVFVSRSTRIFPQTDIDKLKRGTEGLATT